MKLKDFSLLGVKIEQILFMSRLIYIKLFYSCTKYDRFYERNKFNLDIMVTWPLFEDQ